MSLAIGASEIRSTDRGEIAHECQRSARGGGRRHRRSGRRCHPARAGRTAQAAAGARATNMTVRASDHEVRPGEQFVLRGRMTKATGPVRGATVRVLTFRNGGWERPSGAVVTTGDTGRYRVRVVLSSGGDRDLRVVGNPRGDRLRNAHAETVVRVLG